MWMISSSMIARPTGHSRDGAIGNIVSTASRTDGSSLTPVAARQWISVPSNSYTVAPYASQRSRARGQSNRTRVADRRARLTSPSERRWWRIDALPARRVRCRAMPVPRRAPASVRRWRVAIQRSCRLAWWPYFPLARPHSTGCQPTGRLAVVHCFSNLSRTVDENGADCVLPVPVTTRRATISRDIADEPGPASQGDRPRKRLDAVRLDRSPGGVAW